MQINLKLDTQSIRKGIRDIEKYQKDLHRKCKTAVERLIEIGIETAKLNCGEYGDVITFSRTITDNNNVVVGKLIAVGTPLLRIQNGSYVQADPLLLAEFGSGWNAKVLDNVGGVGQGTFPNQTHAFDPRGWWYVDENGEHQHSYGETPTFPMHSASIAMIIDINKVLEEVFGHGK